MIRSKRYSVLLATLTVVVLFAAGCGKNKCYDCVVTDVNTQQRDTINTICEDSPQYTASFLASWKIICAEAHGETVKREE